MAKPIKFRNRQTGKETTLTRVKAGELYLGSLVSLATLADRLKIPAPVTGTLILIMRDSLPALPVESLLAVYKRLGPVKGKLGKKSAALLALLKAAPPLASRPPARRATNSRRRSTVGAETPRQAAGRRR